MNKLEVFASNSFTEEADDALLTFMGMQAECPDDARLAWGVFYQRHRDYALKLVGWKYYPNGDEDRIESLVVEAFQLVWRYAGRFDAKGTTEKDQVKRQARKWLGWLVRKAYGNIMTKEGGQPVSMEDLDLWPMPTSEDETAGPSPRLQRFNSAFSALSEREQYVLRTLAPYRDSGKPMSHTPDEVLKSLAGVLNTTHENVRQIYRRAKEKLRAALDTQKQLASNRGGHT